MARIVCVGLACLDYLFRVATLPGGGGKFFAEDYQAAPGGPAAAAGIAVAALGHEAIFLGRLGDDQVGHDVIRYLENKYVDGSKIRLVEGQSSQVSSVIIDHTGERQIVNYSSSTLDQDPSWLDENVIKTADFLLADVRWPEGAERGLQLASQHGVPSLLDADVSPTDISSLVNLATYTIFSERGLEMVSQERDVPKALAKVHATSTTWPAVTLGEKGSFWLDNGELRNCPAEQIKAVDTCGAGDVFHGAFAVAMAEQMAIDQAMRFASATAALKCLSFGGSLGAPTRPTVDNYLSNS